MHLLDGLMAARPFFDTFQAKAKFWVEDEFGSRVQDADVHVDIWAPNWGPRANDRPTNVAGMAVFRWGSRFGGLWKICVTDITKAGYAYEPGDNIIPACMEVTYP